MVAKLQQEKATLEQSLAVVRESFPEMEASMEALQLSEAKAQSDLQEALARECDLQAELETVRGATGGFIRDFPDEPTEGSAEQVKLLEVRRLQVDRMYVMVYTSSRRVEAYALMEKFWIH